MREGSTAGHQSPDRHWLSTSIGDIAIVDWGNTTLTKKAYSPQGEFLGVSAAGCDGRMEFAEHKALTPVLSAIGANCGRMFLPTEDFTAIKNTITITPKEDGCDPVFLYYLLDSIDLPKRGAGQPFISKGDIQKFPISIPSLKEQRRIVAILDQVFAALDRARALAEANLADAQEILDSIAHSIFSPEDLIDMRDTTLGKVCQIRAGAGFPHKYQGRPEGEYPFYKVSDMNHAGNEWALSTASNYIDEAIRKNLRANVFPRGSIVFPKVGGAIATNKKRVIQVAGCVDNNVMGLIADVDKVLPEYLHEWLRSVDIYDFSNKANPPSITQSTVSSWPFRVPSRDYQCAAVERIESTRSKVGALRNHYSQKLSDISNLRQSLLQKAFSGQLT